MRLAWPDHRSSLAAWLIEHSDGPILVDAGELATASDLPFVHFAVTRDDEVDRQLERPGVAPSDLRTIVLTHGHGDHIDGLDRLPAGRAQIGARELTADGTVAAAPTPGHTPGHLDVVVVIDGVHHLLAGDATYDQAQLLELAVDGIAPRAGEARATMRTILRHAAMHPTVYLPTHDAQAPSRLAAGELLRSPA